MVILKYELEAIVNGWFLRYICRGVLRTEYFAEIKGALQAIERYNHTDVTLNSTASKYDDSGILFTLEEAKLIQGILILEDHLDGALPEHAPRIKSILVRLSQFTHIPLGQRIRRN